MAIMKKKLPLLLLTAALIAAFSAGCNTIGGAGKDLEKAGEKIQDSAKKNS